MKKIHVPDNPLPDGVLISDDDDSFISETESEGGFGGANADENGSKEAIPNEGAQGHKTLLLMVKVGVGPHKDVTLLRG